MIKCLIFLLSAIAINSYAEFDYQQASNQIIKSLLLELRSQRISSSGIGGQMFYEINSIRLELDCYQSLKLEDARFLYLAILSKLVNEYNCNRDLRPYLHNYPFTIDNISLMLSFDKEFTNRVNSDNVALILMARGKIIYQVFDDNGSLKVVFEEPMNNALVEFRKCIILKK